MFLQLKSSLAVLSQTNILTGLSPVPCQVSRLGNPGSASGLIALIEKYKLKENTRNTNIFSHFSDGDGARDTHPSSPVQCSHFHAVFGKNYVK